MQIETYINGQFFYGIYWDHVLGGWTAYRKEGDQIIQTPISLEVINNELFLNSAEHSYYINVTTVTGQVLDEYKINGTGVYPLKAYGQKNITNIIGSDNSITTIKRTN